MKVFPSNNEKIITVCIVSTLIGLVIGITISNKFTNLNFVLTSLTTLLAAYLGAKFAFQLQVKKQEQNKTDADVKNGNKTIFELIRTYNKFIAIRNQFINPQRQDPLRHYLIQPISGVDAHITDIDFDSLTFLIKTNNPDILNKLSSFQQEANSTVEAINQRSAIHFNVIQPAVERAEKAHGQELKEKQIDEAVGKRYSRTIKISTNTMIECVDTVILLSEEYIKELNELLKNKYKGHSIIKMEIPNKNIKATR